jgi:hypothetical protein
MDKEPYAILQALSKHPASGRYLPSVSRYTHEQSKDILRTIICNEDITEREINAYLATKPERFSVFFFLQYTDLNGYGYVKKELRGSYYATIQGNEYGLVSGSSAMYISPRGFKTFNVDEKSDLMLTPEKINNYHDAIRSLDIPLNLNELKNATWMIFFDPFTNYNIFMNRINCNKLIQNYSNDKAIEQFNSILSLFSDNSEVPLLLVYLTYSLRAIDLRESMHLLYITDSDIQYNAKKYIEISNNYINIISEKLNE